MRFVDFLAYNSTNIFICFYNSWHYNIRQISNTVHLPLRRSSTVLQFGMTAQTKWNTLKHIKCPNKGSHLSSHRRIYISCQSRSGCFLTSSSNPLCSLNTSFSARIEAITRWNSLKSLVCLCWVFLYMKNILFTFFSCRQLCRSAMRRSCAALDGFTSSLLKAVSQTPTWNENKDEETRMLD